MLALNNKKHQEDDIEITDEPKNVSESQAKTNSMEVEK